jgi:hypothetical protein
VRDFYGIAYMLHPFGCGRCDVWITKWKGTAVLIRISFLLVSGSCPVRMLTLIPILLVVKEKIPYALEVWQKECLHEFDLLAEIQFGGIQKCVKIRIRY